MKGTVHRHVIALLAAAWLTLGLPAPFQSAGGLFASTAQAASSHLSCDETLKSRFRPDPATKVTRVRHFKKGEPIKIDGTDQGAALADLCMVELLVGPGNPGPVDAPSTSAGITIEIWLPEPANWNGRINARGGGGWSARLANDVGDVGQPAQVAGREGSVSAGTNGGHNRPGFPNSDPALGVVDGQFMFEPDGSISKWHWEAFGSRAVHELAVKTKALTAAYYGQPAKYAYWVGGSQGGRQGMMAAQAYPDDFDGILAAWPAVHWLTYGAWYGVYAPIVIQRDLAGKPLTAEQQALVQANAVSACDSFVTGRHDGFVSDPDACVYNPVEDTKVICKSDGGQNGTPACITKVQAMAFNKVWYGLTRDGTAPDPLQDNGSHAALVPDHLVWGYSRGALLYLGEAQPRSMTMLALNLHDPTLAPPTLPSASGADGSRNLSYADLGRAFDGGVKNARELGRFSADDPNLAAFKAHGSKLIMYHGLADEAIPFQISRNYYNRVIETMGGLTEVQKFFRYYLIPGQSHHFAGNTNFLPKGVAGISPPPDPPVPTYQQLFGALTNWVEKDIPPEAIQTTNVSKTMSRPACLYPQRLVYQGGDVSLATSYGCH
jgi:hypothetical protein